MTGRRTFLQAVLGLLGYSVVTPAVVRESYYYDWQYEYEGKNTTFTDDPTWGGSLPAGPHWRLTVDGKEVAPAVRLRTGPHGWADVCKLDEAGKRYIEEDGRTARLAIERICGDVVLVLDPDYYGTNPPMGKTVFVAELPVETTTQHNKNFRTFTIGLD